MSLPNPIHQLIRRLLFPVGYLIVKVPRFGSYKEHLTSLWFSGSKRTWLDNLIYPSFMCMFVRFEYLKEKDPDKREALKAKMIGGQSGISWAETYDASGWGVKDTEPAFFNILDKLLASSSGALVVQMGCSSGREIQYFALRYPQHSYIGTDVFQEVVEYAAAHRPAPHLEYAVLSARDAGKFVDGMTQGREVIVFSDGCLQYVQPEHVDEFFKGITRGKVVINETISMKKWPKNGKLSRYRENLTFTHDYEVYAENAGFKTIASGIILVDKGPTGHYFYYGERE